METSQNAPASVTEPQEAESFPQDQFISYKAMNGFIIAVGDMPKKMSLDEFASSIGVARKTLWRWENGGIPNFWQKVKERREKLMPRDMVSNVWNRVYVDAMAGNAKQQEMFLIQFDDYKPPHLRVEHDVGAGFLDLLNMARERQRQQQNIQEAEVVDGSNAIDG